MSLCTGAGNTCAVYPPFISKKKLSRLHFGGEEMGNNEL